MYTTDTSQALSRLFSELVDGTRGDGSAFILNTGDVGLLQSLDKLLPGEASASTNQGATIAAHAQHVRYGLSLMNQWAREGGNPFANAGWDDAWKVAAVDALAWDEIRDGLREETQRWLEVLQSPREVSGLELAGMISSVAHLAYHVGAIRQISKTVRGPKEGTFQS
jgi:hypothetical protein